MNGLADVIYLKSGAQFKGTVAQDNGGPEIQIKTNSGVMTFKRSDIDRIEKGTQLDNALFEAKYELGEGNYFEAVSRYSDILKMPGLDSSKKSLILKDQENAIRDLIRSFDKHTPLQDGVDDIAQIERFKTILSNPQLLDLLQAERKKLESKTAQAHFDEAKRLDTNGDIEGAAEHYAVVLNNFPKHPLAQNLDRILLNAYLEIGEKAYKENMYRPSAKARSAFSEVLSRSADNAVALFYLGQMEVDDKNYAKAKEYLLKLDPSKLENRDAQKRLQLLQRIETSTQPRVAPTPRPVRTPEPTPTPQLSKFEKIQGWFSDKWAAVSKGAQDIFASPAKLLDLAKTWGINLGMIFGGFFLLWYLPMKLLVKDLPNRRVVYYNWRRIVSYTGIFGLIAYYIDRWYREEPGKRCPKCNRNINNPELFEDFDFEKCPYCEATIKPPFTLSDIIQQRAQMIVVAKQMSAGVQDEAQREEMINLLTLIMTHARKIRASDIHIEPEESRILVRFRVDGVITESLALDGGLNTLLSSCIKIVSNLDIAERRLPQDGHFRRLILKEEINVRVSTIPTRMGEKVVMRLLDQKLASVALDSLGVRNEPLEKYRRAITAPHGLILATGPTGSGKTTLHYASLQFIND
ncbi:Flp pilus assembly complex ATPase component TadA, partial [bacterium]|nr:Flp pilus assembly complex ATPase component TadA [bacterium]